MRSLSRAVRDATRNIWRTAWPAAAQWLDLKLYIFRADRAFRQGILTGLAGAAVAAGGQFLAPPPRLVQALTSACALIGFLIAHQRQRSLRSSADAQGARCHASPSLSLNGTPVAFSDLHSSEAAEAAGFAIACDPSWSDDSYERSTAFDDALVLADTWPFVETACEKGTFFASGTAGSDDLRRRQMAYLLARLSKGGVQHNDAKVGLRAPLKLPIGPATVYRCGYYDGLVTNEAFRSVIDMQDAKPLGDGNQSRAQFNLHDAFPVTHRAGQWHLHAFPTAGISNHTGVTTLALTCDGYLLFFRQPGERPSAAQSIVASGSGSVDYADLWRSDPGGDLLALLRHAMARELCEETQVRTANGDEAEAMHGHLLRRIGMTRSNTTVTGFFRWVERCGKPEFVGVTRLDVPFDSIAPNCAEVLPLGWRSPRIQCMADFVKARDDLAEFRKSMALRLSLSTHICLSRLCEIAAYAGSSDPTRQHVYRRVSLRLRLDAEPASAALLNPTRGLP